MKIGSIEIPVGAALAPMAGISDLNMRLICHEQGSAYSVTEMLSAKGYVYAPERPIHKELLNYDPNEGITALQLFGSEERMLTKAAQMLKDAPFAFLDFNMGCPAHKIVQNGEGSALMREPVKAGRLLSALVKASSKPVTVKIRSGWDKEHINAVEIAKIAEDSGAAAITVHPRTRDMFYSGKANWDIIAQVKRAVTIPVVGNGDIVCASDALGMLTETGCDAVMVARGAQGNPWIFSEILAALRQEAYTPPNERERVEMLLRHIDMQVGLLGEKMGVVEMRKHIPRYLQGMPQSATLRARINQMTTQTEVTEALKRYIDDMERKTQHGEI